MSLPHFQLEPTLEALREYSHIQSNKIVAGQYQVGGVIGVGTYGEVRYAVSLTTGERVAIKIVDLARFSSETAGLMRKEISILRMLNHPHCTRLIDVHENVTFTGKWCESCACTCFKANKDIPASLASPLKPSVHISANTPCTVCSHSASEHSGVNYSHDDGRQAFSNVDDIDDEEGGETRQVMLIVQELAAGGELFSLLSHSGPLPEDVARLYFQQLIEGCEHLHSLHIAHRDLKPENLVFDSEFQLKIADYGLASFGTRVTDPNSIINSTLAITQQQQTQQTASPHSHPPLPPPSANVMDDIRHYSGVGSQPYAAPESLYVKELYHNRGYRGPPADIWSAGVILFVMLTGRPPFVRPLAKTYGAHLRRDRHFVKIQNGEFPEGLHPHAKDLLSRLLKLAPSERLTIADVKKHPWYMGAVPTQEELVKLMMERSMKSWSSNNSEMTHVLSKMRNSSNAPSVANTPLFGALSPSASPAFSALHSPSFSASSVPPSPFASAQPGRQTPDSQSFVANRASPFLNAYGHALHHSSSSFVNPSFTSHGTQQRHATIHASSHSAALPMHHSNTTTIASSTTISSSILFPPTNVQVSLLRLDESPMASANTTDDSLATHSEIPPPLPPVPDEAPASEFKDDCEQQEQERIRQKESEINAMHALTINADRQSIKKPIAQKPTSPQQPSARATASMNRQQNSCSFPSLHPSSAMQSEQLDHRHLPLNSSQSFPPRNQPFYIRSTLDHDSLLQIVQSRLEKRGCKYQIISGCKSAKSQMPHSSSAAALDDPQLCDSTDECSMHVSGTFHGESLSFIFSIRVIRSTDKKGRVLLASRVKGGDLALFKQFFESFTVGLSEDDE